MDTKIDLDLAAQEITQRLPGWVARGLSVGPVTWRDQSRGWPPPIVADRAEAPAPDSVGVRLTCGEEEGEVVLYVGGWADVIYWAGRADADALDICVGDYDAPLTPAEFGQALDNFVANFQPSN